MGGTFTKEKVKTFRKHAVGWNYNIAINRVLFNIKKFDSYKDSAEVIVFCLAGRPRPNRAFHVPLKKGHSKNSEIGWNKNSKFGKDTEWGIQFLKDNEEEVWKVIERLYPCQ